MAESSTPAISAEEKKRREVGFRKYVESTVLMYGTELKADAGGLVHRWELADGRIIQRIACRLTTLNGDVYDPCLILPENVDPLLLNYSARDYSITANAKSEMRAYHDVLPVVLAGGQVAEVAKSEFTLPWSIIRASAMRLFPPSAEHGPLLVSIDGDYSYLIGYSAVFFEFADLKGKDVQPELWSDPDPGLVAQRAYKVASAMIERTTVVLANI